MTDDAATATAESPVTASPVTASTATTASATVSPAPAAPTKQTLIGMYVDMGLAEIESVGKPAIEAAIGAGEVQAEAMLADFFKSLPKPPGIEGALATPIIDALESGAEKAAAAAVAKYGPDAIFTLIDAKLHIWAQALGG